MQHVRRTSDGADVVAIVVGQIHVAEQGLLELDRNYSAADHAEQRLGLLHLVQYGVFAEELDDLGRRRVDVVVSLDGAHGSSICMYVDITRIASSAP